MKAQPAEPSAVMPPELTNVLVELSNALHKHAMYPTGHPMLLTAADNLVLQLSRIFEQRTALALGVSPMQIIAAGVASDPAHRILRDFAARLHRRNIGALKLYRGVERAELVEALQFIASETEVTAGGAISHRWHHIRIHPVSYSQLELIGDPGSATRATSWATKVWLDLTRAALEDEAAPESAADPAEVARAIDGRHWDETYGQKITESLTDLLDACRARGGSEAMALQRNVSRLITSMAPETLERLVTLERNEAERQRFLLEITQAMAVDAALDLVQAAAHATSRSISPALVQLLGKLAEHSESGPEESRHKAEFAFRNQVKHLIEGWEDWERKDPAPRDHQRTLDRLKFAGKSPLRGRALATYECEPERILMLSLELGVASQMTYEAAAHLINLGKTPLTIELCDRAPFPGLGAEVLLHVVNEELLRTVLSPATLDVAALQLIVPLLGPVALPQLLEALSTAELPERRDQLLAVITPFGEIAGEMALAHMDGADWAVQRNLLVLLTRLPSLPRGFSPSMFSDHPDPPVRTEALRILLLGAASRVRTICEALGSTNPAVIRLGIGAAVEDCPSSAVPLLIPHIERGDFEPGIIAAAVRAMARVHQPLVLECLVGICFIRGRWFRRARIARKTPVVLAALSGLARYWPTHPKAQAVLALAASHPEPGIRAAVEQSTP